MTTKSAGRRDLLDRVIRAHRPASVSASHAYTRLIESVRAKTGLLSPRSFCSRSQKQRRTTEANVQAISRMSRFPERIIRSAWTWTPSRNVVYSLSKHLFGRFEVPEFTHRAWFGDIEDVRVLLDMARGISPRKAIAESGLGSRLTKKAAHRFANAPDRFSIPETIRWAQAIAFGASDKLASRIVIACRGYRYEETFWQELLRFLIYASNVQPGGRERSVVAPDDIELAEIARFVWQQKYEDVSRVLGYRVHHDTPLQPELSLKGRTLRAFRRHMQNWRNEIEIPMHTPIKFAVRNRVWAPSGFDRLSIDCGESHWKMVEILESLQLRIEGGLMQHCVASYESSCRSGRCSIWSLRKCVGTCERPVVTVEVWPDSRQIVQMKARRNAEPTDHSLSLIRRWADANQLAM
ncbi:PcfJ domain-containing protein [Mariniblastus fucicola]|uniref:Uncharacterized protein n=1 Tax=Mariniblastus fucicola TaxID=980251 RepID=A0A5B9PBL3_9BACT|nr:PcfJ domain-containing protein [Mariniblastus fucicola]QEG22400.1 hypothetical protein MFFC18_22800 [Mariniblastus fucicola]